MSAKLPIYYKKQLGEMDDRFFLILEQFKKSYPLYKANQDYDAYEQSYLRDKVNLQTLSKDLFLLENSLDMDMKKLNKSVTSDDFAISKAKMTNTLLNKEQNFLSNTNNGAQAMEREYKYIYRDNWINTLDMGIGTLALVLIIYRQYKNS